MAYAAMVGVAAGTSVDLATEVAGYKRFQTFAGRLDMVSIFLDQSSEEAFIKGWQWSVRRAIDVAVAVGAKAIRLSIPFPGATLDKSERFNRGDYDDLYIQIAQYIRNTVPNGIIVVIRLPWEFNLDPAFQNQGAGKAGYGMLRRALRRMAGIYYAVFGEYSRKVLIEWCPNVGTNDFDPEHAWPGIDFVDIVAQDIYFDARWDTPATIFEYRRDQANGLRWGAEWAKKKNCLYALAEHGTPDESMAPAYAKLGQWLGTIPHLHSHTVYDREDGPIAGAISNGARPAVASAYLNNFGLI